MAFEKVNELVADAPAFTGMLNLAEERLGGKVLYATDDFFAEKENLLKQGRGIFIADRYTDRGKWMDGWESRRKRTPGHDWCIIQLATTGTIAGFDIDTNHFLGNHPPFASIEGAFIEDASSSTNWHEAFIEWETILPKSPLHAGSQNFYHCAGNKVYSHIRLHIYPDGGVARLKVYGEIHKEWGKVKNETIDLAAAINGGNAIACNDMFFSNMNNLIMPGRGVNMGDGWETKRNRTPNNRDWVIIKLAKAGFITKAIVDTCHFKGNYPDRCSIEGCLVADDAVTSFENTNWQTILPEQKLNAHEILEFEKEIVASPLVSHVRFNIFPDGGVSRLRLIGKINDHL